MKRRPKIKSFHKKNYYVKKIKDKMKKKKKTMDLIAKTITSSLANK